MVFDLEKAIAAWRRTFEHNRTFFREDLEELERHVRDHVADLAARGRSEEEAFQEAIRALGDYGTTEAEYRKVFWAKVRHRHTLVDEIRWWMGMLKSYLTLALRSLRRQPGYAFINIFGLAVGVAASLLIAFYVRHELSYDRFHEHAERIYRLVVDRHYEQGRVVPYAPVSPPLAPALLAEVPEVRQAVRLFNARVTAGGTLLRRGAARFYEPRFFYADPQALDVFSFRLRKGDVETALQDPRSVVISEAMAEKYFGREDPIGQVLVLDDSLDLHVTAVMQDLPANTHLKVDFLAPFSLLRMQYGERLDLWGWDLVYTYLLLPAGRDVAGLTWKIQAYLDEQVAPRTARAGYRYRASLQPLTDIHLHSNRQWEIEANSSVLYPYAFAVIAAFILLIACINFINLSTARTAWRAREIGMRKVLGGRRGQLISQFLCESILLSLFAVTLALAAVVLLLPLFSALAGTSVSIRDVPPAVLPGLLVALVLAVGLAAGGLPALYLSSLRPLTFLRGAYRPGGGRMRRTLVVAQFVISIALISGTMIIHQQLQYVRSKHLGFDKEHVVVLRAGALPERVDVLKQELLRHPGVTHVTAASGMPGGLVEQMRVQPGGAGELMPVQMLWVDYDFVRTLGIAVVEGRDFSKAYEADEADSYIINEAAAEAFGWSDPVGKELVWPSAWGRRRGPVVGVVQDFHAASLREHIGPLVLLIKPVYRYLGVRIEAENVPEVLAWTEDRWRAFAPGRPFEYAFLDEAFDRLYARDEGFAHLFSVFAGLAILIACLGLFGLVAFTAEQRTKEIGIRKVLGATVTSLVGLLSKEYLKLVLVALLLAAPAAYLAMRHWLEDFAYRIEIDPVSFVLAGLLMLLIALLTAGYQSVRAALADPVKALRHE